MTGHDAGGAERGARDYAVEHQLSAPHDAALRAYAGPVSDWLAASEIDAARLLATSEHGLRLMAARRA
jgi:hypothetical protein